MLTGTAQIREQNTTLPKYLGIQEDNCSLKIRCELFIIDLHAVLLTILSHSHLHALFQALKNIMQYALNKRQN